MRMRTVTVAMLSAAAVLAVPALFPTEALASSHREAPFISKNPKVDGTDFYMFNSYETGKTGFVTIIANYQPLEDAYGGPNYFPLDPDALYEIMIDNTGDGVEDLTFQFQFQQALGGANNAGIGLCIGGTGAACTGGQTVAVPFINVGDIRTASNLNVNETYTIGLVTGPRRAMAATPVTDNMSGMPTFTKPADYVGPKSYGAGFTTGANAGGADPVAGATNYATYANQYIRGITIPGCSTAGRVFVGQRAESFPVNLGSVFDLIDAPASVVTAGGTDANAIPFASTPLGKKNLTSIALELPASCITSLASPVIGGWTTASVRQARVVNPGATYTTPTKEGGAWTQVSRLGMPLVNEVVIGLPDKDAFNASSPPGDVTAFGKYVEYPTLPHVIDLIFGVMFEPQVFPRLDLVEAFAQGVPGVNAFPTSDAGVAPVPAEMIRLNTNTTAIPVTPAATQSPLGAALCFVHGTLTLSNPGCDPSGFPNGRRPGDDVVDITMDVAEGYLLPTGAPAFPPADAGTAVLFTDGVQWGATNFQTSFPYMNPPHGGANGDGTFN